MSTKRVKTAFDPVVKIGVAGAELYEFRYSDVLNGAVQESGLVPELRSLPPGMTEAIVTGEERKFQEHKNVITALNADLKLVLPPRSCPARRRPKKLRATCPPCPIGCASAGKEVLSGICSIWKGN